MGDFDLRRTGIPVRCGDLPRLAASLMRLLRPCSNRAMTRMTSGQLFDRPPTARDQHDETPHGPHWQETQCRARRAPRTDRPGFRSLPGPLAALALAVLLASCGSSDVPPFGSTTTSHSTNGPTTTGPASQPCGVVAGPGVVVTRRPEPCTVSTRVGATVHIVLDPGFRWDNPKSDSNAVEVVNINRQTSGRLDADLRTERVGEATVSAVGAVLCPPGQPCPALARLWEVHVSVGS
jgi:hypothetical protein